MVKISQNYHEDAHDSVCFSKFVDFCPSVIPKRDSVSWEFFEMF